MELIRNERIRGITKMGEICKKVQERRLKYYGHVMRRLMVMDVPSETRKGG